ncbi:MAG: hypothetical protein ACJ8M1_01795 [Chthoniobacterales bacterium]
MNDEARMTALVQVLAIEPGRVAMPTYFDIRHSGFVIRGAGQCAWTCQVASL